MAWWGELARPEPEPEPEPEEKEPVADTEIEELHFSKEAEHKIWRLSRLMDALVKCRPDEPISLEEIELLARVADAYTDLHDACDAIRKGCELTYLVIIYT